MNSGRNRLRILIIDDERHIRQSFADFLEDQDFEVILAENGRIGLKLFETKRPDLVLLDLRMPALDGFEVLEQSRQMASDTPVIVISGANRTGDVVRALRYGAWDYLEKPVMDLSILGHAVGKALEKARLRQENRVYQEDLEKTVKERTRQFEEANTHLSNINGRLRKIVETTQSLTGCVRMKEFGVTLLSEFADQMGATGGSLYITEQGGLKLLHALDPGHAVDFLPFPLVENSIFKKIMELGQPLLIADIKQARNVESSQWVGYTDGSLLAFPIMDGNGNSVGTITLHSKNDPPFMEQDKEIGAILASHGCETLRAVKAFETVKKSEKKLRQSQKMEAIGTLAGGIAHDFNNILSGILGYAQLLEMNINKPKDIQKNIDQVKKGAHRAGELVQQILTFSRQAEQKRRPLKIYLIIKEAVKFLRSSIPSTIDIIEKINTRKIVLADATQIHQVVMNLCTNAYHAMRDTGGTLSVSLNDVMIDADEVENDSQPGLYIKLEIKDTGKGIEKKEQGKIFDPYFTTKKIGQGTGLGLAVVDGIVKNHDGFITVSSTPGRGSIFQVYFPVVEELTDQEPQTEIRADSLSGTEKIMLVDDEKDILDSTRAILEIMGYHVFGFMDGISALEAFEKNPKDFDLVITDMTMPKMNGRTLSKKILFIRKDIPVILSTGFHETFSKEEALKTGIRRYIQKPVSSSDLALIIREELEKNGKNHEIK